ncbi:MAG: FAD-binding protein [Polyangiaceae bacterium]
MTDWQWKNTPQGQVMIELHRKLHARSEFVERCIRLDGLPDVNGNLLMSQRQMRESAGWRVHIQDALQRFEVAASASPPPVPAEWHRWKSPQPSPAAEDFVPRGGAVRKRSPIQRPAESGEPPVDRVETEADSLVAHFTRQQATFALLQMCAETTATARLPIAGKDLVDADGASIAQLLVDAWGKKIIDDLILFYDAAILELLSGRTLAGEIAIQSYDESLRFIRDVDTGSKVPARRQLERLLGSLARSTPSQTSLYWYLLRPDSILDATQRLIWRGAKDLASFCFSLFLSAHVSRNTTSGPSVPRPPSTPTGRFDWFYEPDRLRAIVAAAHHALARKPNRETDRDALNTLIGGRELFLQATENTHGPSDDPLFGVKGADPPQLFKQFRDRRILDTVWWNSFLFLGDDAPAKLAEWCGQRPPGPHGVRCLTLRPTNQGSRNVIVFGAGIAGLTAAHELAERNFKVFVVEAAPPPNDGKSLPDPLPPAGEERTQVGGMARTQWTPPPGATDRSVLIPGEHGYRLFPSFYRHVFDTMKRTPLSTPIPIPGLRLTAFDQLQPTFQQVFATRQRFVPLARSRPRSLEAFRREYMSLTEGLGFSRRDLSRFFFKLLRYLMACSARREKEYERVSLLELFGADQEGYYSERMARLMRATPQALVAMDAERCDARTQGNVYLQLLLDQVFGGEYTDSVLSGPTSTSWLAPWRDYLDKHLDVKFSRGQLLAIHEKPGPLAGHHEVELILDGTPLPGEIHDEAHHVHSIDACYVVVALDVVGAERVTRHWDAAGRSAPHDGVPRELRGYTSYVERTLPGRLDRFTVTFTYGGSARPQDAEVHLRRLLRLAECAERDPALDPRERSVFRSVSHFTGELVQEPSGVPELRICFWTAQRMGPRDARIFERVLRRWCAGSADVRLTSEEPERCEHPVRVRTPRLRHDPYGETPQDRLQTFTGVQFYFDQDFKLVRGHVYFPDSEWGLSAVSQSQFWIDHKIEIPGKEDSGNPTKTRVRGVLSVDLGDCRRPSSYTGKSVLESSNEEIAREVWRQIEDNLRTTRGPAAPVTNLPLPRYITYHVDSNLEAAGDLLRRNRTPFLVNNVGDWQNRPRCLPWIPGRDKLGDGAQTTGPHLWQAPHGGYRVHDGKVVFCGAYMRTFTRMSTMEAANESARHAVNAILEHLASTESEASLEQRPVSGDYCTIWDPEENELEDLAYFKRVDEMLFKAGKPHIADILQLDKLADLQYPEPTPVQSLIAALGATAQKDWGVQPNEVAGSANGLLELLKGASKDLSATGTLPGLSALGGMGIPGLADPLQKLLSLLGGGRNERP